MTSRLLEFCGQKELIAQTGHDPSEWPLVILKELLDNALDACEESGVAPEITVTVDAESITVTDCGSGLPPETVKGILDFSVRASSREAYVSPTRGAQGNALKTIAAMPFAVSDDDRGRIEIAARRLRHEITFVDQIHQRPVVEHDVHPDEDVKIGTRITVFWPDSACSLLQEAEDEFLQLARGFACCNPHLTLTVDWFGKPFSSLASVSTWKKWLPSDPTPPHWYGRDDFKRLVAAYIAYDSDRDEDRAVRRFIHEFRGLSATAKQKAVLDTTSLTRTNLSALVNGNGLRHELVDGLLAAMKEHSRPVKPAMLGTIGRDHLIRSFEQHAGADAETFQYRKATPTTKNGMPCVVEVAFAGCPDAEERVIISGVNWSPAINNPFRSLNCSLGGDGLEALLVDQEIDWDSPVIVFVHLVCPQARYTDRGKSAIAVDEEVGEAIVKMVKTVTNKWARQRRAEERAASRMANRWEALKRTRKVSLKDAAYQVMREAYLKASTDGTLPAKTRQIYYAARGRILAMTGREKLGQQYFSQTLVPDYMDKNPEETADWDVVYDARGKLIEPHTNRTVPLGTIEVRRYLWSIQSHKVAGNAIPELKFQNIFPTCGPDHRFGAVMFVEKEGFDELFQATRLAERYDLAVMSTKGMSVTACRHLADELCGERGIPLLVLHDFDKAGFSIVSTLQRDTRRYEFQHHFPVIDLGIRLADADAHKLESEDVFYGRTNKGKFRNPKPNLAKNGAAEEEIEFLAGTFGQRGYSGRRVELNAFTSGKLMEFIESKLAEHGIKKIVPDARTVKKAYRRAMQIAIVNRALDTIRDKAVKEAEAASVPRGLKKLLDERLAASPQMSWDAVLAEVVEEQVAIAESGAGLQDPGERGGED